MNTLIAIMGLLLGIAIALVFLLCYAYAVASDERDRARQTLALVRGMLHAHDHFGQTLQSNQIANILRGMDQ